MAISLVPDKPAEKKANESMPLSGSLSMLSAYLKEREGVDTLETEQGYATYVINGTECYIKDVWVKPEHRKKGTASDLGHSIEEIARGRGCKLLTGSVSPSTKGSTDSLWFMLKYGMRLHSSTNNLIIFAKDL